jgi:beta-phosphoglucomutase
MIKCILYDLDGVLVDACEWHYISLNKALEEISKIKISREEHEIIYNGWPTKKKLDELLAQGRIRECDILPIWNAKQKYTKDTIKESGRIDANKMHLHVQTKLLNIRIACVTNSIDETARLMLEQTGQLKFIDILITNNLVKNPKPHGEGYIRAMIALGFMPDECLIVEDSPKGLLAAQSTGAHIYKVDNCAQVNTANILKEIKKI